MAILEPLTPNKEPFFQGYGFVMFQSRKPTWMVTSTAFNFYTPDS